MYRKKLFVGALLLAGCLAVQSAEPQAVLVPTPRAKMLAATAANRPFLGSARLQQPQVLTTRGYGESEFAVRGSVAGQPYLTRILVRKPQDSRRFSGRVIVELLNATPAETSPVWGYSWDYFVRSGDAWVGVTLSPGAATLRKFNASRYGELNVPVPEAEACRNSGQTAPGSEVLAQVGALLRSSSKENPLWGLNLQRLLAAGQQSSGDALTVFAAGAHRKLRLGNGAPIFDGYLVVSSPASALAACTAAMPRDVSFVSVLSETDALRLSSQSIQSIADAQNANESMRIYEVAGVAEAGLPAAGKAAVADLTAAGISSAADAGCREPVTELMLSHVLNAVWQQFDDLLVRKQPMIRLPQIESAATGNSGGWQLPQVELPFAGQAPDHAAAAERRATCDATFGSMARFDVAKLKQLYSNRNEYLRRFAAAADRAVAARLLLKEDADALKAAAPRFIPAF